jgi:hypothetical protein
MRWRSWGQEAIGPTLPMPRNRGLRSTPSKVILGSGAPVRDARVGNRSRELASSWVTPEDRGSFSALSRLGQESARKRPED